MLKNPYLKLDKADKVILTPHISIQDRDIIKSARPENGTLAAVINSLFHAVAEEIRTLPYEQRNTSAVEHAVTRRLSPSVFTPERHDKDVPGRTTGVHSTNPPVASIAPVTLGGDTSSKSKETKKRTKSTGA